MWGLSLSTPPRPPRWQTPPDQRAGECKQSQELRGSFLNAKHALCWSFHRRLQRQARPWGPLCRHAYSRNAQPVHSLVVLSGATATVGGSIEHCCSANGAVAVVYNSECHDWISNVGRHTHTHTHTRIPGELNLAKRRSRNRKVVGWIPGLSMPGSGRWQPCFKGIFSGEIAKLSRPWRPPRCREHHQLRKPQYTQNTRGSMAMMGSLN